MKQAIQCAALKKIVT